MFQSLGQFPLIMEFSEESYRLPGTDKLAFIQNTAMGQPCFLKFVILIWYLEKFLQTNVLLYFFSNLIIIQMHWKTFRNVVSILNEGRFLSVFLSPFGALFFPNMLNSANPASFRIHSTALLIINIGFHFNGAQHTRVCLSPSIV